MTQFVEFARRHRALADFGELALDSDDLTAILVQGCQLVASAFGADFAKILEIDRASQTALVCAGVGWAARGGGTGARSA